MSQTKKSLIIRLISIVIISMVLGLLCVIINGEALLNILFLIIGALLVIDGVIGLINTKQKTNYVIISNSISIILGILLMFNFNSIVNIIIAIWFIGFPIYEIYRNKENAKEEFKAQLPMLILGAIIIIFGIGGFVDLLLKIIGWSLIAFAIIYLIIGSISLYKHY